MSEKDMKRFIEGLDRSGEGCSVTPEQSKEEQEMAALWDELGQLDAPEVSRPELVSEFRNKLEAYEDGLATGKRERLSEETERRGDSPVVSFFRYLSVAGIAAALALSCFIAWEKNAEAEELAQQLDRSRESLALALLEQGSAPKRLEGLTTASLVVSPSSRLRDSMVRTFDSDTNLNVRLAAVSALTALPREEALAVLLERMENESSPLVQFEILNKVLELVDDGNRPEVIGRLNKLPLEPRVKSALAKREEQI